MKIGESIKKIRKELFPQLNQGEFAECIGISQTFLSQIEKGKRNPSLEKLVDIANYCNTPLPIIFWFSLEESDVDDSKKEYFNFLKPTIDSMIESVY